MNGRNASRPGCPAKRSSGTVLLVATTTTPRANNALNSRPRIIASAMSLTWNSSKHSSDASAAIASASGGIGSSACGSARRSGCRRQAWMRWCASCMNWWKWIRRLRGHLGRGEEQVHQHAFAAPDLAHDVEPVRIVFGNVVRPLAAQEAPEQAGRARRRSARSRAAGPTAPAAARPPALAPGRSAARPHRAWPGSASGPPDPVPIPTSIKRTIAAVAVSAGMLPQAAHKRALYRVLFVLSRIAQPAAIAFERRSPL